MQSPFRTFPSGREFLKLKTGYMCNGYFPPSLMAGQAEGFYCSACSLEALLSTGESLP